MPTVVDMPQDLVGPAEIGRMLGVGRQRVHQLVNRPDFPEPEAALAMGKVWLRESIRQWAERVGRNVTDGD